MIFNDHHMYEIGLWPDTFVCAAYRLCGEDPLSYLPMRVRYPRRAAQEVAQIELVDDIERIKHEHSSLEAQDEPLA